MVQIRGRDTPDMQSNIPASIVLRHPSPFPAAVPASAVARQSGWSHPSCLSLNSKRSIMMSQATRRSRTGQAWRDHAITLGRSRRYSIG